MKLLPPPRVLALGLAAFLAATLIAAKPPAANRKEAAAPTPAVAAVDGPADPGTELALARWLVAPSGKPDAIVLPFSQVVRAASGKAVLPFDTAHPVDAAMLTKIGAALDLILPKMNRAESSARAAAAYGDAAAVAARFEAELQTALGAAPVVSGGNASDRGYPAFRLTDPASGRTYYLAATLYPSGSDPAGEAFALCPGIASDRLSSDGCCLLVGIEYNGKVGRDIAFLNWEVSDLSRLKVRFQPVFQATLHDAFQPGAILTDGHKGRD